MGSNKTAKDRDNLKFKGLEVLRGDIDMIGDLQGNRY